MLNLRPISLVVIQLDRVDWSDRMHALQKLSSESEVYAIVCFFALMIKHNPSCILKVTVPTSVIRYILPWGRKVNSSDRCYLPDNWLRFWTGTFKGRWVGRGLPLDCSMSRLCDTLRTLSSGLKRLILGCVPRLCDCVLSKSHRGLSFFICLPLIRDPSFLSGATLLLTVDRRRLLHKCVSGLVCLVAFLYILFVLRSIELLRICRSIAWSSN